MHLLSGRAFAIAAISCLVVVFLISNSSIVTRTRAQDKSPQKPAGPAASSEHQSEPASAPTPPKVEASSAAQEKALNEFDNKGVVITNTDLITVTVTVTDTYGRYVSGLGKAAFTMLDEKKPQEITFLVTMMRRFPLACSLTSRDR